MSRQKEYDFDEPYVVIEKRSAGVGSFLLGLAVGAGLALLYAPRTGEETRRELGRGARRVRSAAREVAGDLSESMADQYEQTKRSVEDRLDSARQAIEMRKRQATEAIRAGREAAQQARQELEARIAETKEAYRDGGLAAGAEERATPATADDTRDAAERDRE